MPLGGNFGSNPFFNPNYLPGHYAPQQNQSQPQQQSASLVDIAAEQQADAPQVPAGPATGFRSQAIPEPPPAAPEAPPEETAPPPSSVTPPTTPEPVAGIPDIPGGIPRFDEIDWEQVRRNIGGNAAQPVPQQQAQLHKADPNVKQPPAPPIQPPVGTPPGIPTRPVEQPPMAPPIQMPVTDYTWNSGAFAFAAGGMVDPIPGYQRGGHITEDPERLAAKLAEMQAARMSHQADQEAYWADYRRNQEKVPYQKYNRVYTSQGNYRVPAGTGYEYKYTGDMEYPTRGGSR